MDAKTYEPMYGIGRTGAALERFGANQNALNAKLLSETEHLTAQIEALNSMVIDMQQELTALHEAHDALQKAHDALKRENDRLRLTARLNANAIDRLTGHDTAGGDAS